MSYRVTDAGTINYSLVFTLFNNTHKKENRAKRISARLLLLESPFNYVLTFKYF